MELLTPDETKRRLHLDDEELEDVVRNGHLSVFRLGQRIMFYTTEVESLAKLFSLDNTE
jgi:hypothetical protein